jgi:DNA-binding transcriptional LysR family regulator
MELELRHLNVVCTIADAGSISKAAAELGVAQSALTAQLARIERALGGPAFDRDHRGVRPTQLGELVIARSRLLLPAMTGLVEDATRLADGERHDSAPEHLSIGSAKSSIIAPLITRLGQEHPHLRVTTTASWSSEEVAAELADGTVDFAVVGVCWAGTRPGDPSLVWRTFSVDPVFVLVSEAHPLAGRAEIALSDLSDADWAITPGDKCFPSCFARACARDGFTPRNVYVTDSASCLDLVAAGAAVAPCQPTRTAPGAVARPLTGVPLRWHQMLGVRADSPAHDFVDELLLAVRLAHADLVAGSPAYAAWLQHNPGFGEQHDPGITPAV